jgi:NAD(P)-dependent dehydrogenase (short-subunit alcohol dehydrogenase family)
VGPDKRLSHHFVSQGGNMTNNVWFITGAGRGMGLDIAKAALAAGHKVVATGRNTDKVAQAAGDPPTCWW